MPERLLPPPRAVLLLGGWIAAAAIACSDAAATGGPAQPAAPAEPAPRFWLGRIHPGAFVSVAPHDGATWLVAVPRYARENGPVLAYVQKDALGPAPREPQPPSLGGKVMRDFPFTLWDNASSRVLVDQLLCGDFHVTVEGSSVRGTQLHDGIEVSGLLETGPLPWPWGEQGENTCMGRRIFRRDGQLREGRGRDWLDSVPIDSVPGGYRHVDVPAADPFSAILRSQASVFWLVQTARGLECHEWKAKRTGPEVGPPDPDIPGELWRQRDPHQAHFKLHYSPSPGGAVAGGLSLRGPTLRDGGYKCVRPLGILGMDEDRLHVNNPPIARGMDDGWTLVAYHPDDVEHWFLRRDACETARARAAEAISRDPAAIDHVGRHHDCFQELAH